MSCANTSLRSIETEGFANNVWVENIILIEDGK